MEKEENQNRSIHISTAANMRDLFELVDQLKFHSSEWKEFLVSKKNFELYAKSEIEDISMRTCPIFFMNYKSSDDKDKERNNLKNSFKINPHTGKKGSDIEKIKGKLSNLTSNEVVLNIKEVKKPETNSYLVAENIAQQLVKRISYRRAMKRAMQSALRLGAKGIKVSISGRLGGNEIARTEWLREGSIPSHTLRADIDYAEAEALTTYGIIGIKVWIYKGEVFAREFSQETNKVTPKEGKE